MIGRINLKAIIVNVACPSQVVEGKSAINADYWLPVRNNLKARYGEGVVVLGWGSAAGRHVSASLAAQGRQRPHAGTLRGIDEMQELARRIDISVSQTFDAVRKEKFAEPVLKHAAVMLQLPLSKISEAQYHQAQAAYNSVMAQLQKNPGLRGRRRLHGQRLALRSGATLRAIAEGPQGDVSGRDPRRPARRHGRVLQSVRLVLRIRDSHQGPVAGDADLRCPVVRLRQLSADRTRPQAGGSYSAIPQSNIIGPEGGQMLVDKTVEIIKELWK